MKKEVETCVLANECREMRGHSEGSEIKKGCVGGGGKILKSQRPIADALDKVTIY
jgi:hypothetical protein